MKYCCYMVGIATTRPHSQQAGRCHDWIFCDNNRLGKKKDMQLKAPKCAILSYIT